MSHNQDFSKEKAACVQQAAFSKKHPQDTSINHHAQRQRFLTELERRAMTTLQIRRDLDMHRVARYVLVRRAL